jgi:hypothetical protein
MESWLATYSGTSRERALDLYLRNIPEQHRESERQELLIQAKFAQPLPMPRGSVGRLTLERKVETTLKTTLFDFSAPNVEGCEVALQTYTAKGETAEWVVGLWAGGAVRKTSQTSLRSTFEVGAGQHKRVFLRVPVVVTFRYAFIPGKAARLPTGTAATLLNRVAGELSTSLFHPATAPSLTPLYHNFTKVEPLPEHSAPGTFLGTMSAPAPGAESIKPPRARGWRILRTFPLKNDRTGRLTTHEYEHEKSYNMGVSAAGAVLGSTLTAKFTVRHTKSLRLTSVLAGGYDYQIYERLDVPGIEWLVY